MRRTISRAGGYPVLEAVEELVSSHGTWCGTAQELLVMLKEIGHWEVGKPDMPCNPSYFAKHFKLAVGSVEGVRVLTPHSCRHTFVSMMQMLGVDIETILDYKQSS